MPEYRVPLSLAVDVTVDVEATDEEAAEAAALTAVSAFTETVYSTEPGTVAVANTDGLEAYEIEEITAS